MSNAMAPLEFIKQDRYDWEVLDANKKSVMLFTSYYPETPDEEDARRMVDCYNALAGIEDPEAWVAKAKKVMGG